jgi:hypothetical protein
MVREFKATGKARYKDIAANAWQITINAHTYSIGGNSQGETFRAANMISKFTICIIARAHCIQWSDSRLTAT